MTYAPVQAEEFGITSENIDDDVIANSTNPAIRRFLGLEDNLGERLGLNKDFVAKIIKQTGNYGEIYERNFSGLERGRNSLWQNNGLLYSPPFAGTLPNNFTLTNNDNRNLLQKVKERGVVQLGVTGNSPAFAVQQANGEWIGFDIELGKAIAAAIFGDASKLKVVVQNFSQGFDDVANGVSDIFAAGITQNLVRDAARGVDFSPTYLYTGQGFLVREDSGINFLSDLNGRTIGLTSSTSGLQNIQDYFAEIGGNFRPEIFSSTAAMFAAYQRGEVDAISTDQTIIAGLLPTLTNPDQHKLLNSIISKEPLALAIDENQSEWADLVRWVTYSLVQAEELGISSANIENLVEINTDQNVANDSTEQIRTLLGIESNIGVGLGVSNDFVVNLIKAVGNYGEIYERNFGGSILSREQNQLYIDFGLQFSPPFTATPTDINEPPTPTLTLSESGKSLLRLNGDLNNAKLEVALTDKHVGINNVHEVGLFVVDDAQGRVNGLLPSDPGYLQAALSLSQTIFSVVSREFVPDPIRNLDNFKGQLLSFYLVQNGSTDEVVNNPAAQGKVLFGSAANNLQIQGLDINQFQLTFEDQLGDSSADLTLTVRLTETAPPLASNLQGKAERQLIDLRNFGEQSIQAVFPITKGEAAYKNTAGFYKVENEQGTVLDPLTRQLLNPSDRGYTQASLRNIAHKISLNDQSEGTSTIFTGGSILAPFIIANGNTQQILDSDASNDLPVYFNYIGANPDRVDHIRLLGNNIWGFEDIVGNGDQDFDDIVIQAKFQVVPNV